MRQLFADMEDSALSARFCDQEDPNPQPTLLRSKSAHRSQQRNEFDGRYHIKKIYIFS
jgi:hypothetical protein